MNPPRTFRYAVVAELRGSDTLATVQRFMPSNYTASQVTETGPVFISGHDNAGWTLDSYVIPRLGSGLITAREVTEAEWYAAAATGAVSDA